MTDKEEQTIQKLEIIGIALSRAIKKNKNREYVMSKNYIAAALGETQKLINTIRGGKNGNR